MKLMLLSIVLCTFAIHGSAQEYTDKYKNGNIKIHGYYNEDTGEEEGHWIWYNEDGTKAEECDYVNGKREGLLKTYVRGKLFSVEEFHNGRKNGITTEYYSDNSPTAMPRKRIVLTYVNDVIDGLCRRYDLKGHVTNRYRVSQGDVVTDSLFTPDGFMYETMMRIDDPAAEFGYRNVRKTYRWPSAKSSSSHHTAGKSTNGKPATGNRPKKSKLKVNASGVIDIK